MVESNIQLTWPPLVTTPPQWVQTVMADFPAFLRDHASCEKKASGMAMSVASHYPDRPHLLSAMIDLAVEELNHYRQVVKLLLARNLQPGAEQKDPYVNQLNQHIRRGAENFLLDRLLVAAVIERRGAERFALVAEHTATHLHDPQLQHFYQSIAASEDRHWLMFLQLAEQHCDSSAVAPRFAELCRIEGETMLSLPMRAALH